MIRLTELKLPLSALPVETRRAADAPSETEADRAPTAHPLATLTRLSAQALGIAPEAIAGLQVFKRSFDARKAELLAVFIVDITLQDPAQEAGLLARWSGHPHIGATPDMAYPLPGVAAAPPAPRPVVVGFGPCGMFAALLLAQMGLRPLLLERGQPVKQRSADTFGFWRGSQPFDPESNAQFGEGGAGTFSDGKLYSQVSEDPRLVRKVLEELVAAGANAEILTLHRPHIGTFKLATVVRGLRAHVEALGGEVRFGCLVQELVLEPGLSRQVRGVKLASGEIITTDHVAFAPGHSARDSFAALHRQGVAMQPKPFAIGVRIEHPQPLIDRARWGAAAGHPRLGPAEYKLVHHIAGGRDVYSF